MLPRTTSEDMSIWLIKSSTEQLQAKSGSTKHKKIRT